MGLDDVDAESFPIVNVAGEKVALGPLHDALLPLLARWDNDFQTAERGGDLPRPRSPQAIAAAWGPLIKGERPQWIGFAVYELPGLRPIGVANVRDFVNVEGTAEFGLTIGEPDARGKGYGTEATRLVLDYAFTVLGVHNVWLDTAASNVAAIRAYARAGFKEIGRRREARRLGDHCEDVVQMDCLATDFVPPATRVLPRP
ncbi:MAG: GNAT family N-acetyltransferase [Chloroflexota bacterium]|nr:GNAT family N-acetyltransferase [Chloroflexota bacterium]